MLEVRNLCAAYENLLVLKGISIDVGEGELVALIGSNGAGKSTFLMTLCGVKRQTSGEIEFLGRNIAKLPPHLIFT